MTNDATSRREEERDIADRRRAEAARCPKCQGTKIDPMTGAECICATAVPDVFDRVARLCEKFSEEWKSEGAEAAFDRNCGEATDPADAAASPQAPVGVSEPSALTSACRETIVRVSDLLAAARKVVAPLEKERTANTRYAAGEAVQDIDDALAELSLLSSFVPPLSAPLPPPRAGAGRMRETNHKLPPLIGVAGGTMNIPGMDRAPASDSSVGWGHHLRDEAEKRCRPRSDEFMEMHLAGEKDIT